MLNHGKFLHKLLCLLAITMVLPGSFAFGQKKGAKPVASKCSGAWTGTVTYMRRHIIKDNKKTPRVSNGVDEREFRMTYEYVAKVLVTEGTANTKNNVAKASVDMTMTSRDKTESKEKNSCDRGKTWKEMSGTFINRTETTGQGSTDANVTVGVNADGTYSVSVGISDIAGKSSGSSSSTCKGQCTEKKGTKLTMPEVPATVPGPFVFGSESI
jgi:hypothetical protein